MSLSVQAALSRARRAASRGKKSGFTLVELLVVISIIGMLMALLLPQIQNARETSRGNTCRSNMRAVAFALFSYANRVGSYPGYINALQLTGTSSVYSGNVVGGSTPVPVGWPVMIMPEMDRQALFDQWRMPISTTSPNTMIYLELLMCPSDPQGSKQGTPISFVANTGQMDVAAQTGIPRDWAASGYFFDNFTNSPLVQASTTGSIMPQVIMRDEMCRDPKDKTILLTENVDANNYAYDQRQTGSASAYTAGTSVPEADMGSIWALGTISAAASTSVAPTMIPPILDTVNNLPTLGINANTGRGDPNMQGTAKYAYARPSSRHPQSVNVAFAGQNVTALRDAVSYFIFAKLMASDDDGLKQVGMNTFLKTQGTPTSMICTYQISESDLNP